MGEPLLPALKVKAAGQQWGQAGRRPRGQETGDGPLGAEHRPQVTSTHRAAPQPPSLKEVLLLTATCLCKTTLRSRTEPGRYLGFGRVHLTKPRSQF